MGNYEMQTYNAASGRYEIIPNTGTELTWDAVNKQIAVSTSTAFEKTFYVMARSTSFDAVKRQEVHIFVCGGEKVVVADPDYTKSFNLTYTTRQGTGTSIKVTEK